jgi:hypothetical protein
MGIVATLEGGEEPLAGMVPGWGRLGHDLLQLVFTFVGKDIEM